MLTGDQIEQLQQEIRERQQAQALLQETEERYRSLVAAIAEGIIVQDANGVIHTCNAAAERILGLSAQQLIGQTSIDPSWCLITEDGEPFPQAEYPVNVTLRTGQPCTDVVIGIHKPDDTLTWISVNSQPLFHPQATAPYAAVASFTDITKRKKIETELRESEERFRFTFEQAAVGLNHNDLDGKFIRVNQKFCDITGYTREELLNLPFQSITHPDDLPVDVEYMRSLVAGEIATYVLDKRYRRKDDTYIWVQVTVSLVRTSQGTPKYCLSVVQDISDRKAAEAALHHSQAQLRERLTREALLNQLSSEIRNSLELNTILATATSGIRQILHIDRCQFAWYCPHDTNAYWDVVHEARNPDASDQRGCYSSNLIGPLAQQILNLEILRIDDTTTVRDPTFREFVRANACTSVLILPMQTPWQAIGIIACIQDHEIRPWSDSEVELLQAVRDQLLIALKQAELYAASCRAAQEALSKATQLEQALHQLRRTQAQLIQSEKMSSLGQLVAGVAHEINNPVNFIYGNLIYAQQYCQDLLGLVQLYQEIYTNPPAIIQQRIEAIDLNFLITDLCRLQNSIKLGAERIREIVRSLRTFSRLDEVGRKQVDIHSGLESTLMILHNRIKGKPGHPPITVIKEYSDLPLVECYPGPLNQVFLNILANAIDALEEKVNNNWDASTPSALTLTIHTGVVENDGVAAGDSYSQREATLSPPHSKPTPHIFIRIADTGTGMAPQTLQNLFIPFFTTKPVGRGTGLGLAISYQIVVEKHNGKLWCNSVLGEGTEFVIELPIE